MYYVVKFTGQFGFIKPWTAVRDGQTFSQQFLTPSILEGIEKKLFPELLQQNGSIMKILRNRLSYRMIDVQQEQTQTRGWQYKRSENRTFREQSILLRGVMVDPVLYIAFSEREDAERACTQHICLCRNEDVLFPVPEILEMTEEDFNVNIPGFELHFGESPQSFLVGYNRFDGNKPMYGWLEINGKPVLE